MTVPITDFAAIECGLIAYCIGHVERVEILESIGVTPTVFSTAARRWAWAAVREGQAFDLDQVERALFASGIGADEMNETIDGLAAVTPVSDETIEAQARRLVAENRRQRKRAAMVAAFESMSSPLTDPDEVLTAMRDRLDAIGAEDVDSVTGIAASTLEVARRTIEAAVSSKKAPRLLTGVGVIDDVLGGLRPGQLVIVASRPGQGKSQFLLHLLSEATARPRFAYGATRQLRAGIVNLELSHDEMMGRILASKAQVSHSKIRNSAIREEADINRLVEAANEVESIVLSTPRSSSIDVVWAACRQLVRDHRVDLITVDYLGLIRGPGESKVVEVSNVSRSLKEIARSLGVPVVVACQPSRACEREKRPLRLDDLRDSGQIEADADVVLGFGLDRETERLSIMTLKHRGGPLEHRVYRWDLSTQSLIEPPSILRPE